MMGSAVLGVACLLVVGGAVASPGPGLSREIVLIDGHDTTIATATAEEIDDHSMVLDFGELILSIVLAFNEPEFDYWGNVQEEVEALVGQYINQHNMNQVEAFQADLETLLIRYLEAPEVSDNYPDKNHQASALAMAIISHRYLVMSGDMRFSLILHFEDIASMHIVVLKDAAETYSTESAPSQWWVDLNEELKDYLVYSTEVQQELVEFRLGKITCSEDLNTCRWIEHGRTKRTCYDIYTVTDGVTGETFECRQLHGATDCVNHCQTYEAHRLEELEVFAAAKLSPVTEVWAELQQVAQGMADVASPYRNPARRE